MGKDCGIERAYNNLFAKDESARKISKILREYYRKYQGIDWHASDFLPRKTCMDLLDPSGEIRRKIPDFEHGIEFTMIWTLFCWGESKGIYEFDSDLADELNHAESNMLLTEDMFLHAPDTCMALHLPNLLPKIDSVFFLLSQDGDQKELYIVFMELDTAINDAGEENISYVGLRINRDPLTVHEIWKKTRSESHTRAAEDENSLKIMTIKALMEMNARDAISSRDFEALSMRVVIDKLSEEEMSDIVGKNIEDMVQKVLPYYLYVCSENADIICTQSEKQRKINPEIIPRYRVGQNVGRVLRKHKKIYINQRKEKTAFVSSKRPHYRCGHFRRQLYGCRPTTDEKDTRYHKTVFIPPSYINMKDWSSDDPNHLRTRKITCNKDA